MNLHDRFIADHQDIRRLAAECRTAAAEGIDPSATLKKLQETIQLHFRREDVYYRKLDDGKRINDRGLMHQMRNDHAAVLFTLESLAIRLRKNGPNADWQGRLKTMLDVLLPHLDNEEKTLYPLGSKILSTAEFQTILNEINALA